MKKSLDIAKERNLLLSVLFVVFIDMIGVGIAIPVVASIFFDAQRSILGPDVALGTVTMIYGFLLAIFPIAQFFGAPILGALSDKYGRKKILMLSLTGTFLGYFIFAVGVITKNIPLLFAGRLIDGFTGGNISIALSAISDISDAKSKAKNFGLVGMAFGVGFIIGPLLGGVLASPDVVSWFNSSVPFAFAAVLCLINIILLSKFFPETIKKKTDTKISLLTGMRNIRKAFEFKHLRTVFIVVFLIGLGFNFYTQFMQVYLIETFKLNELDIGIYFGFIGLCIAIVQGVVTRYVSKKFSPEQVMKITTLGLAITLPLFLLPKSMFYIYTLVPFVALFQGLTYPNSTALVSNLAGAESQGEVMGINQSMQSLAMAFPPMIAGLIAAIDIRLPILMSGIIIFSGWLIFVLFYRGKKEDLFHEV